MTSSQRYAPILFALLLMGPPGAADGEPEDPKTDVAAPAEPAGEATAGEAAAGGADPAVSFRLYARRDVGLRLAPNAGLRVRPLEPSFSPRTADFEGREPTGASRFALSVAIAPFSADGERDSAKAQEFCDLSGDVAVGLDLIARGERDQLRLTGRHLTLDDSDLDVEWRRFGVLEARLRFDRIPHRFAFDAASLYSGLGTGRLTFDPAARQTLAGSTSFADAAERARALFAAAPVADLELARDRLGVQLDLTAWHPLEIEIKVDDESREGVRPWSGTFGYFNFVEIPWAVDYRTTNAEIAAEYAAGKTLARGSYRHSSFDNEVGAQLFDNPWRTADSTRADSLVASFASGPATGLIDLYPSNEREELTLTLVRSQLPLDGTLAATVAASRMEQDDPLLAYTTNTAIVPGAAGNPPFSASDPANLPAARAGARFDSRLVHLRWTSRPADRWTLAAHFRDFSADNESSRIVVPGFALEDHGWRRYFGTGDGFTNLPIAWATTSFGVDLGYRPAKRGRWTLAWEREEVDRDFREVEESVEDRFKLSLDAKPAEWLDLRASYLVAERDAAGYAFDQFFTSQGIDFIPALPFLLKFDQASRDRSRLQLLATLYPQEAWILSAQVIVGEDEFPESRFGVTGDDHEVYSIDLSYAASERLSLFAALSRERYDVALSAREWVPFGPGDPFRVEPGFDSASNWTAESRDDIDTVTVGLDVQLIPDRLRFELQFSRSESDGRIRFASPVAAFDANPFVPVDFGEVDDVTFYNLNPELTLEVGDRISLRLAYAKEKYEIIDFNNSGFQLVPTTRAGEINGGLFMGTLPGDFDLEVLALELKLAF